MGEPTLEVVFTDAASRLLNPTDSVCVAVSGGPDSVALLHLLCGLNQRPGWSLKLHVAHLNHQLRGADSEADADFVQRTAAGLGLPCHSAFADVQRRASAEGLSIEVAGRLCRTEFFERVCDETGARIVALAHHADDNAETILHRILRGTGLRGLGGIPSSRLLRRGSAIRLIRPMLGLRREQIVRYLGSRGVAWRVDGSNAECRYTRNRIRNELLPLLKARFNPHVEEAILRLATQARTVEDALAKSAECDVRLLLLEQSAERVVLHTGLLARYAPGVRMRLVRQAIRRMGAAEGRLGYRHYAATAQLADDCAGTKMLHLPGLRLTRRYDRLIIEVAPDESETARARRAGAEEVAIPLAGCTDLPDHDVRVTTEVLEASSAMIHEYLQRARTRSCRSQEEWFDADCIALPLIARGWREGDAMVPLGMSGTKKLSDLFTDAKLPLDRRGRVVVLCDAQGPIWAVPLRMADRVRLTAATRRVLCVRAESLSSAGPGHRGQSSSTPATLPAPEGCRND